MNKSKRENDDYNEANVWFVFVCEHRLFDFFLHFKSIATFGTVGNGIPFTPTPDSKFNHLVLGLQVYSRNKKKSGENSERNRKREGGEQKVKLELIRKKRQAELCVIFAVKQPRKIAKNHWSSWSMFGYLLRKEEQSTKLLKTNIYKRTDE